MKTVRLVSLSLMACAGALAVACGSSSSSPTPAPANTGAANGFGESPVYGPNYETCGAINTGYDGDGFCILPPDSSVGMQVHYGPSNYTDPAEVAKFVIKPGQEMTDCMFMKTPNTDVVYHSEYHGRMRPGSHHMLVFTQTTALADSTAPGGCNQGLDTSMILGAQTPTIDLDRNKSAAPENAGFAQKLEPNSQLVFQMHFINATDHDLLREGWATVIYRDPASVTQLVSPIFFIGGYGMNILPNTSQVLTGKATWQGPDDTRLLFGTGHFHAHTVRFAAWATSGGVRQEIFEDYNWHEPSWFDFDSVTTNTMWDQSAQTVGATSGIVNLKTGDTIDWECDVVNDSTVALHFANEVYTGEMCNMFGGYGPSTGKAWDAANVVPAGAVGTPIN